MLTQEQVSKLGVGLNQASETDCLIIESGLQWLINNTTLSFDINDIDELVLLPANVKLFLLKFRELYGRQAGVSSESISGLSHSFSGDCDDLLWQLAEALIGSYLKSRVRFILAAKGWKY